MIALLLALNTASASGLDVPQLGSPFSGPQAADAASVYYNPANLVRLDRRQMLLSGGGVAGRVGYTRERLGTYQFADSLQFLDPVDEAYIDPTRSGTSETVSAVPASPWANAFVGMPINDKLAIGGGFFVPYAAPLTFDPAGDQRFALQKAFIAVTQLTVAMAYAPSDTVQFGAGVSYVSGIGSISRTQDFAALDSFGDALSNPPINQENSFGETAPTTVRELDVLARPFALTNSLSHGIDFNLGVTVVPSDAVVLGLSYHHGSMARFKGDFTLDMNDDFFTQDLASQGIQFDPLVSGDAELAFRLPGRVMLGVGLQPSERFGLDIEAAYVLWRTLKTFDITLTSPQLAQPAIGIPDTIVSSLPRRWQDSVHVEVTPRIAVSDTLLLGGTLGYHSPASPDATVDVSSPDGHRMIGALAGSWVAGEKVTFLADVESQTILPRVVTTSDYDLGNGTYNLVLFGLGLHAQLAF